MTYLESVLHTRDQHVAAALNVIPSLRQLFQKPRNSDDTNLVSLWAACRKKLSHGQPDPFFLTVTPKGYAQDLSAESCQLLAGVGFWYAEYIIRHAGPGRWSVGSGPSLFENLPVVELLESDGSLFGEVPVFTVMSVMARRELEDGKLPHEHRGDEALREHFLTITNRAKLPLPDGGRLFPALLKKRKLTP